MQSIVEAELESLRLVWGISRRHMICCLADNLADRPASKPLLHGVPNLNSARQAAIAAVTNYKSQGPALNFKEAPASEIFASNVLGHAALGLQVIVGWWDVVL